MSVTMQETCTDAVQHRGTTLRAVFDMGERLVTNSAGNSQGAGA